MAVALRVGLLFCLAVACVSAQERVLALRDFAQDHGPWFVGETTDGNCTVERADGVLHIEERDETGFRTFGESVELDHSKNWSIKVVMRQVDAEEKMQFGIVFNGANVQNLYMFAVRDDNVARINRIKENDYEDIDEWTKAPSVKSKGAWNTLEVRKVNDAIAGYVNGKAVVVMTASYYRVYGDWVGIMYYGAQTVEVKSFEVKQRNPMPIRPVIGVDPNVGPVSIGSGVNTTADESVDCVSSDGTVMYFSRKDHPENVKEDTRDVWVTTKNASGVWSSPQILPQPVNTAGNNFAIAVTQDLNTLFMQGTYESDGTIGRNGISYVTKTKSGWSKPVNMLIDNYVNINSIANSHLSPDGRVLVTSIQTYDSHGSNDLYVCFRKADDTWTEPKNLGSLINTHAAEMGPFIAGDGVTMFFSTTGHPGYGGRDLFVTRRLDDSWLRWTEPENLGNGLNTDEHETFIQVPSKGDSAYFSTQKGAIGQDDIVAVPLPSGARPKPLLLAKGRVLNAETKQPIAARVVYETLPGGKVAGTATSSEVDGSYRVGLLNGMMYGVRAEAEGFYPLSEQFDARTVAEYAESGRDLYLNPIKVNVAIRLNNVFFESGKSELRTESYPELDRLVEFLVKSPSVTIALSGHTDNVGSDASNLALSQDRINSVQSYLIAKGIATNRMTAKGYGKTKPVATNDTEDGRQQNRRVEFTILGK